ncbi:TetR/AcrR family transcriptional regulator [Sphingomonas sp. MG17]|uniref:TetR/AcrR family transcriptional regulator n=1 Tax=Sphingomonas tagetis TaxID=2949092 RepID=A0A9X2KQN4_9SPHN|nr:TetR/AcrR family transcriptional regulator [Sphingomonas tagetis]MCP3731953.1 TetR/AcrR family transcriptional regulator [Sphingomonas tagetis]
MSAEIAPTACLAEPRKAGRPRDPAKYSAIVAAAREAFFARGFHAATIEDIAHAAGVSKVTVYSRFGDKETLFEEVIRAESGRMAARFDAEMAAGNSLEERLNAFGLALTGFKFSEEHLAVDRVLMNEIAQMPELAQRFFAAGPELCMGRLGDVLGEAAARGEIDIDDADLAADDIVGLWLGGGDLGIKLGLEPPPSPEALRARVQRATRLFLKMVGSKP